LWEKVAVAFSRFFRCVTRRLELTALRRIPSWRGSFMMAWQVIERLYHSEINAGLQSDWDWRR
jgi:hypothetical protein